MPLGRRTGASPNSPTPRGSICGSCPPPLMSNLARQAAPDVVNATQQLARRAAVPRPPSPSASGERGCSEGARGRGGRWLNVASRFPPQGAEAPPLDSAAIPTKTGGAHVGHKTREDVRERKPAHSRSRTRQDSDRARARRHPRTPTRAGDAPGEGHDCGRRGHARWGRAHLGEG